MQFQKIPLRKPWSRLITQNIFGEIKDPKHLYIIYYRLLKFLTVKWFCALLYFKEVLKLSLKE